MQTVGAEDVQGFFSVMISCIFFVMWREQKKFGAQIQSDSSPDCFGSGPMESFWRLQKVTCSL